MIAFDYRGFGDSSRALPTEETLRIDALSMFNYIVSKGVDPSRIILVGHSLGSGIAADLAYNLCQKAKVYGRFNISAKKTCLRWTDDFVRIHLYR